MKTIQTAIIFLALCVFSLNTNAQKKLMHESNNHIMVMPKDIKWTAGPLALPAGAKKVILEGDPKDSGLFTLRFLLPAGYKIMPHRHTAAEHITVIQGTFYMGVGEKFDERAMKAIPTSGFAVMSTGTPHYGLAKQECIIQIHGVGPRVVNYVNPNDDPRKKK